MNFDLNDEHRAIQETAPYTILECHIAEVHLEDVRVPKENLFGEWGKRFVVAVAKCFAGEVAVRNAGMAMEIHGGMGYSLEMPVERYYRESKLYQIGEGTANIMRLLIADDALGIKKANRPRVHVPSDFRDLD